MLTLLITLSLTTTTSALQLPVREVLTLEDSEPSVLDFIRLSYQPLLFPEALSKDTLASLTPWTFPSLSTSLEAATTFCVASTGSLNQNHNAETDKDVKKREKNSDVERKKKGGSKENADSEETEAEVEKKSREKGDDENLNTEREAMKKGRGENVETSEKDEKETATLKEKTKREDVKGYKKTEKENAKSSDETEGSGKTVSKEEEGRSKGTEGAEKEIQKEIPMSLRRFGMEERVRGWVSAFTTITKELG